MSMKKSLMATAAAVAMIAGPQLAFAQKQEAPASKVEAPARAPAAQQNAPAEKVAPPAGTTGQATPNAQSAPGGDKAGAKPEMKSDTKGNARTGASTDTRSDTKAGTAADTKSDTKSGSTATDTKSGTRSNTATDTKSDTRSGTSASDTRSGATGDGKAGASVQLSTEQRTQIRTTVLKSSNAPRVTNVNFSVRVGTVVPKTVRVVAVPAKLVEIQPAWRGYMYFVYQDEIIIVEPGSLRIVAVLNV
jgi:hypothetical protein